VTIRSKGLRLSLAGAVVFLVSALALILLPKEICVVGMLAGGMAVWIGFIWTIFGYYSAPSSGPQ
jgi:hypothetical protein